MGVPRDELPTWDDIQFVTAQLARRPLLDDVEVATGVTIGPGATRPLHSGHYGNWAPNPVMRLAYLLTSMRAEDGRILIDGYYDNVQTLSELQRDAIANMPDTTELLKDELSIHTPEGSGQRLEELIMLPALNVRGRRRSTCAWCQTRIRQGYGG